jgi:hypothetical protein
MQSTPVKGDLKHPSLSCAQIKDSKGPRELKNSISTEGVTGATDHTTHHLLGRR